jgi:hypothetical protein
MLLIVIPINNSLKLRRRGPGFVRFFRAFLRRVHFETLLA